MTRQEWSTPPKTTGFKKSRGDSYYSTTDVGEGRKKLITAGYHHDKQFGEIFGIISTQKPIPVRIKQYIKHFKIENGLF